MELPALRRYIQENETSIKDAIGENKLLEWLLFIDDPESEFAKMAEEKNELIGRARDMLKTLSKNEKLQEEYMAREKAIMDKYSALSEAEEKGIEKGIVKGIVKGERKKAIDASKKMIQDGLSLELISKYEGLSIHELEQIKKRMQNENE
jgi:predicted transposase/invertase (TIGR01784 family)